MPLLEIRQVEFDSLLGIWDIKEDEHFFLNDMDLSSEELEAIDAMKGGRKLEWLSSRYLIQKLFEKQEKPVVRKDSFGKPQILNFEGHISISHSNKRSAVIFSRKPVGIDIQLRVERIPSIAHKFMFKDDIENLKEHTRIETIHVHWGAKESIYKAYGRKEVRFKEHILIEPFDWNQNGTSFKAKMEKPNYLAEFEVFGSFTDSYFLVYAFEKN